MKKLIMSLALCALTLPALAECVDYSDCPKVEEIRAWTDAASITFIKCSHNKCSVRYGGVNEFKKGDFTWTLTTPDISSNGLGTIDNAHKFAAGVWEYGLTTDSEKCVYFSYQFNDEHRIIGKLYAAPVHTSKR